MSYSLILDCLYRVCVNVDGELLSMIVLDILHSGMMETQYLEEYEHADVFKVIRSLMFSSDIIKPINKAGFKKLVVKIEEYINYNENMFTGK